MEDWPWVILAVVTVLCLVVIVCGSCRIERNLQDCRASGYIDYESWNDSLWCVGMRDGEPYLVPLESVRAQK